MNKVVVPNSILLGEVKSMLAEGKDVVIPTKGNSMLPFIRGGRDSVNLRRLDTLEVGDIVLAEIREGVYVLHRVFAVDGDSVTLKGDGNLRNVEQCRRSDIAGTALNILKENGREADCRGRKAMRRARAWRTMPTLFRRVFLGIYRRIFI
ncbi:MAG: S24/S26 family peptidase [Bacteroidales bacterium]|nr:S24/S26 family peptidase [Bacteroidales bacterium]MBR5054143.1 S24/S26 family peptidase [Bacteroidales bacterium]